MLMSFYLVYTYFPELSLKLALVVPNCYQPTLSMKFCLLLVLLCLFFCFVNTVAALCFYGTF
jgi:hypothetical protein